MTNILVFLLSTAFTFVDLFHFLAMSKASETMYNLHVSFLTLNPQSELLRERKSIPSTIFILVLANRKVFPKNKAFSWLS